MFKKLWQNTAFLAQAVKHGVGKAKVMGSIPK